jgi:hypothetical protein
MKLRLTSKNAIHLVFLVMNLMVLYWKKANAFFVALLVPCLRCSKELLETEFCSL